MITRRLILPGLAAVAAGSTGASAFRAEPATPTMLGACGPSCETEVMVTTVRVTAIEPGAPAHDPSAREAFLRCPICGRGMGRRAADAEAPEVQRSL